MATYLPGVTKVPGETAGASTGGGAKIVHHTTEGGSAAGAISAFRSSRSWPTMTAEWTGTRLHVFQHMGLEQMARALEHPAGTQPTNTANCVQIEHVGFTDVTAWKRARSPKGLLVQDWPLERWHAIAALCREIEARTGCHPTSAVPSSWWTSPHRLGETAFVKANGHCGHVHVPSNSHTDGTGFRIDLILGHGDGAFRVLKAGVSGPDVTAFQKAVRVQASRCGRKDRMPAADGIVGDQTLTDGAFVAYILGIGSSQSALLKGGLSTVVQDRVRNPKLRNAAEVKRAAKRRKAHCKGA